MISENTFSPKRGCDGDWSKNAPVFGPEFDETPLPAIWITQQVREPTTEITGRNCIHRYPGVLIGTDDLERGNTAWNMREADPDREGDLALRYGADYYMEGMETQDELFHQDRIDCFRAAELLYLWGASRGNVFGYANLGYVYSYDRCEGRYLGLDEHGNTLCEPGEEFPRERRAYECYKMAADAGHPEALYKLGDLVRYGKGCEASLSDAVDLWERAYASAVEWGHPTWWGAAALRLGTAAEEGMGCKQSFKDALAWYERAESGLTDSVNRGDWFYKRSLKKAKDGAARCKQEISGRY